MLNYTDEGKIIRQFIILIYGCFYWSLRLSSSYIEVLSIILDSCKILLGSAESKESKKGDSLSINEYAQLSLWYIFIIF